jgi:uncharacterized protein
MRLALESDPSINLIRSYGEGVITIGTRQLTRPCVISARALQSDWSAISISQLTLEQMQPLLSAPANTVAPNIVLLGAHGPQQWPQAAIRQLCRARGIALECMNLGAACRTYNILASEDRAVIAGLFP